MVVIIREKKVICNKDTKNNNKKWWMCQARNVFGKCWSKKQKELFVTRSGNHGLMY
jgi:hypothetical protein